MNVFRPTSMKARRSRTRLELQSLEAREVPATLLDLTTAGSEVTASGAIFQQTAPVANSSTFLSIQRNGMESGYNTDARPFQLDQTGGLTVTHSLLLSDIPTVTISGTTYREFVLDINQTTKKPLITLDELRIFLGSTGDLTGYNGKTRTLAGLTAVYNMDAVQDVSVRMNAALNGTSGPGDAFVLIPDSLFTGATYVYLYSKFGSANNGAETWSVRPVPPPPPTGVLSGYVYFDADNDGVREPNGNEDNVQEIGLSGVDVRLQGTNDLNQSIDIIVTTDANGYYEFTGLRPGNYSVTKLFDPPDFIDGKNTPGVPGNGMVQESNSDPNIPDMIFDIDLLSGESLTEYNFGELFQGNPN